MSVQKIGECTPGDQKTENGKNYVCNPEGKWIEAKLKVKPLVKKKRESRSFLTSKGI